MEIKNKSTIRHINVLESHKLETTYTIDREAKFTSIKNMVTIELMNGSKMTVRNEQISEKIALFLISSGGIREISSTPKTILSKTLTLGKVKLTKGYNPDTQKHTLTMTNPDKETALRNHYKYVKPYLTSMLLISLKTPECKPITTRRETENCIGMN